MRLSISECENSSIQSIELAPKHTQRAVFAQRHAETINLCCNFFDKPDCLFCFSWLRLCDKMFYHSLGLTCPVGVCEWWWKGMGIASWGWMMWV